VETTFYDEPEIRVTSTRLIVRGKTIPLSEVEAIEQTTYERSSIWLPVSLAIVAIFGASMTTLHAHPACAMGLGISALCAAGWAWVGARSYTVSVIRHGNSAAVIVSQNEKLARSVRHAMERALGRPTSPASLTGAFTSSSSPLIRPQDPAVNFAAYRLRLDNIRPD